MGSWTGEGVTQDVWEAIFVGQNYLGNASFGSVRNTDPSKALAVQFSVVTMWQESASSIGYCSPGQDWNWNSMVDALAGQVHPPYTSVIVEVKAKTTGQNGSYSFVVVSLNTDS